MTGNRIAPVRDATDTDRNGKRTGEPTEISELVATVDQLASRVEALESIIQNAVPELGRLDQELQLVAGERDELRSELNRIDSMQTDTLAYDGADDETAERPTLSTTEPSGSALPSIDELIALSGGDAPMKNQMEAPTVEPVDGLAVSGVQELISADEIVASGVAQEQSGRKLAEAGRWKLIRTDLDPTVEYCLDEPLMTIGRSASADIQVDTDFISRIHARLLRIDATFMLEDAGSRNGVRINDEQVARWPLKHGDRVQIGSVPFRFVDLDSTG